MRSLESFSLLLSLHVFRLCRNHVQTGTINGKICVGWLHKNKAVLYHVLRILYVKLSNNYFFHLPSHSLDERITTLHNNNTQETVKAKLTMGRYIDASRRKALSPPVDNDESKLWHCVCGHALHPFGCVWLHDESFSGQLNAQMNLCDFLTNFSI